MQQVTRTANRELIEPKGEPVLTLYIPTHRHPTPPHMKEDQMRFKNLVRDGLEKWGAQLAVPREIKSELDELQNNVEFWQASLECLAVFIDTNGIRYDRLPIECEERIYVGERFDVTPLLLVESMSQPVYVFALSMHFPKLYEASLYDIQELDAGLPKNLEEALNIDEMFINSNTIRGGRIAGSRAVAPHGQGDSSEAGREERLMYLRLLDEKIRTMPDFDASRPMIIAATDTEFGDFRAQSELSTILDAHIPGSHTTTPTNELHAMVNDVLHKHIVEPRQKEAIDRIGEGVGQGKTSRLFDDISSAAQDGRVHQLLLPMIDHTADSVNDSSPTAPLIRYPKQFDKGLFAAIADTVTQGGSILGVQRNIHMPLTEVAADYRY
ncbi:MAG TPA: hypothetical protein QF549_01005 [Candidatus Saccharimonadaceae bacterium]|nr:hypothetical protein [Candidatus Saccharimonadaceae bacterium]